MRAATLAAVASAFTLGAALAGGAAPASAAPGATAAAAGFVTVRHGDTVEVTGASLGCLVQVIGVICYPTASGKPRPGAYAVTLMAPGIATIVRVGPDLDLKPVVTKLAKGVKLHRRTAVRAVRVKVGQVVRLQPPQPAGPIDCAVVKSVGRPTLYCSQDDGKGPLAGTFAVLVNQATAALGQIQPDRSTTITNVRKQPTT